MAFTGKIQADGLKSGRIVPKVTLAGIINLIIYATV